MGLLFVTPQRSQNLELTRNFHRALIAQPNFLYRVAQNLDVRSALRFSLSLDLLLFPQVAERLEDQTVSSDLQGTKDDISVREGEEDERLNLADGGQNELTFVLLCLVHLV